MQWEFNNCKIMNQGKINELKTTVVNFKLQIYILEETQFIFFGNLYFRWTILTTQQLLKILSHKKIFY